MKKLCAMAAAIIFTASISVFASDTNSDARSSKTVNYQVSFSKIIINNDIDLVLVESSERSLQVTGNDADVDNFEWKIKNNTIYLKSKKGSLKGKVSVTLSVNQLKELIIRGESNVQSAGSLESPNLNIVIEADSFVAIRNIGQITVNNNPDTTLDIQRMEGEVVIGK